MEELISMIVANGLWAALFCLLLCYELKDSRKREREYARVISTLSDRIITSVDAALADTAELKADADRIMADTEEIKSAVVKRQKRGAAIATNNI